MDKKRSYVTWSLTALQSTQQEKTFSETLHFSQMLKQNLILQTTS